MTPSNSQNWFTPLTERSLLQLTGADVLKFLQGQITADIQDFESNSCIYTLLLTPQGKYLYDIFLYRNGENIWLDCATEHKSSLIKRLTMFRLRADVQIDDCSQTHEIIALSHPQVIQEESITLFKDPRHNAMEYRTFIPRNNNYSDLISAGLLENTHSHYDALRFRNQIPDGTADMKSGEDFPLQFRMDDLNAISFTKGCYIGQEVTARSKHRGVIRKKIFSIKAEREFPTSIDEENKIITLLPSNSNDDDNNVRKAGRLLSTSQNLGLALLDCELVNSLHNSNDQLMHNNNVLEIIPST